MPRASARRSACTGDNLTAAARRTTPEPRVGPPSRVALPGDAPQPEPLAGAQPPGASQRLLHQRALLRIRPAQERFLHLLLVHVAHDVHGLAGERVVAGPVDVGRERHRGRREVLHLLRPPAVLLEVLVELDRVLQAAPRVRADEIGDQVLLLPRLPRVALELAAEALELLDPRLLHDAEDVRRA